MTLKLNRLEVRIEGAVFLTLMAQVPAVETSNAVMTAFNCVLLTYSVVRGDPFHCTMELLLKFEPITVSEKLPLPARMPEGEMEVIAGFDEAGDVAGCCPPQPIR